MTLAARVMLSAWPDGNEYPWACGTESSTIGRSRWTTSLAPTPIAQPTSIVTPAHSARPFSFFARQVQTTTPSATT